MLAGQSMPGRRLGQVADRRSRIAAAFTSTSSGRCVLPILEGFDLAETDRSSPVRFSTTQPTQALAMLNSTFLSKQATALADRLKKEAGDDLGKQVRLAITLTTGRDASEGEVQRGLELIENLKARDHIELDAARKAFCLVALNLNEFLYLD